ncbi:MAG: DUF1648 domain-containing protein [Chthoniobacterales bacterium]
MKTKLGWLEVVLLAAPFIALGFYWNDLPARVPTHWDLRGQINDSMSKVPGILIVPFTALGVTALLHVLPWFDPKLRRTSGAEGLMPAVMPIVRLATLVLLDTIFLVQMSASLGKNIAAGRIMMTCVLVFFVVLGNYLGNLRSNYFVGIRTTLDAGESRNLAGHSSPWRTADVFRGARLPRGGDFSEQVPLWPAFRQLDFRARRLGIYVLVASLPDACRDQLIRLKHR